MIDERASQQAVAARAAGDIQCSLSLVHDIAVLVLRAFVIQQNKMAISTKRRITFGR
jgi:hypothetical protein